MVECLHCGETPESIKRDRIVVCGIMEGYELAYEFPRHRWADWRDSELARLGVKPEAYEKHRRTPLLHFAWMGCEDTLRGHHILTRDGAYGRRGQCTVCGKFPADVEGSDRG